MEHPGLPPLSEAVHLALDDLEDGGERAEVHARARQQLAEALPPLCARLAENLQRALCAAEVDLPGEHPGLLSQLQNDPLGLLAYGTGRSIVAEALGAEADGGVVQALRLLAPEPADGTVDARLERFTAQSYDEQRCTRPLRAFRVELLRGFHPQTRASALAALDPARLELALELCTQIEDTEALLDAFDQARAEADVAEAKLAPGPPRHFSKVHVAFALLIFLLTAYHYLLR